MKLLIIALLFLVVLVSGCMNTQGEASVQPVEPLVEEQNAVSENLIEEKIEPEKEMPVEESTIVKTAGLGNFCFSEMECLFYCMKNFDTCLDYCDKNPGNSLCSVLNRMPNMQQQAQTDAHGKFVSNNFIDLDSIQRISLFRSGYGHDFSQGTNEECRSMKHYFWAKGGDPSTNHNPSWMTIKYYAPVDGIIVGVRYSENPYGTEAQFSIQSDEYSSYYFRFFHMKLNDGLKSGSKVTAGQHIGFIGDERAHGEIAVEKRSGFSSDIISFFDIIKDNVFEEYKKRGIQNREELIITKELRDANPLRCDENTEEGRFIGVSYDGLKDSAGLDNWAGLD